MKKILIIGPGMELGGVERSLLGLLDSIDYEKYEVDLYLFAHEGEWMHLINPKAHLLPEEKKIAYINYPIIDLFKKRHFLIGGIRLYAKLWSDLKAKIKKTESNNIFLCKKIVSRFTKPLQKHYDMALGFFGPHYFLENKVDADVKIGWVHTDYSTASELPDVKFMLPMWAGLDYIACVSEQVKEAFDKVYPQLREKSIVVENILSAEFVRAQADALDVSAEMPLFEGTNILSVGRFCHQKNFENIPAICTLLKEKGIAVKWYLIGYGQDEVLIRSKIAEQHMEDTVIILGKKSNPYPYMKACDIYVQPSRYEGKAVTVREAQMLYKPVIITNFGTAGSQVNDGVDGYICALSNEGVAEGIASMLEHPELQEKLIENTKAANYSNTEEYEKIIGYMRTSA